MTLLYSIITPEYSNNYNDYYYSDFIQYYSEPSEYWWYLELNKDDQAEDTAIEIPENLSIFSDSEKLPNKLGSFDGSGSYHYYNNSTETFSHLYHNRYSNATLSNSLESSGHNRLFEPLISSGSDNNSHDTINQSGLLEGIKNFFSQTFDNLGELWTYHSENLKITDNLKDMVASASPEAWKSFLKELCKDIWPLELFIEITTSFISFDVNKSWDLKEATFNIKNPNDKVSDKVKVANDISSSIIGSIIDQGVKYSCGKDKNGELCTAATILLKKTKMSGILKKYMIEPFMNDYFDNLEYNKLSKTCSKLQSEDTVAKDQLLEVCNELEKDYETAEDLNVILFFARKFGLYSAIDRLIQNDMNYFKRGSTEFDYQKTDLGNQKMIDSILRPQIQS